MWRPAAGHLALWRAFYPEWDTLDCVAAPEDRSLDAVFSRLSGGRDRLPDPRSRARTNPGLGPVFRRLR